MYQDVIGAGALATTATIVLPNTGSSTVLEVATVTTLVVACSVLVSSAVRLVMKLR